MMKAVKRYTSYLLSVLFVYSCSYFVLQLQKAGVLKKAIEYIHHLQMKNEQLIEHNKMLQKQVTCKFLPYCSFVLQLYVCIMVVSHLLIN